MTDNVITGSSDGLGATFATDNIGGVNWPRQKVCFGDDGVAGDVRWSNPMPVISHAERPLNATIYRRFGYNPLVGTTYELIDELGAALPWMPSSATLVEVLSDSASDTSAGAGARTVKLTGLDANFNLITETLTLNGLTAVPSSNSYIRLTALEVVTVGSYGASNVGHISARVISAGASILTIEIGSGQSFSSLFCVPAGYYGAVTGARLSVETNKTVDIQVKARDFAGNTGSNFAPLMTAQIYTGVSGGDNTFNYDPPILLSEKTDVFIVGKAVAGTAAISVEYWGWYAPI